MMRAFKAFFTISAIAFLLHPIVGWNNARANPLAIVALALGLEAGFVEAYLISDRLIASDEQTNLKLVRTSLDGSSDWRYKVFDGDEKNTAHSFRDETDARAFFNKRIEQKTVR